MGADGHIGIYDYSKLEEKYDEETLDSFFGHFTSAKMYIQSLSGKKYVTRYWGDNYNSSDAYDVIQDCYDRNTGKFNTKSWSYDSYAAEYFLKLDKSQREAFVEIIDFMEKECRLTSWEVWT